MPPFFPSLGVRNILFVLLIMVLFGQVGYGADVSLSQNQAKKNYMLASQYMEKADQLLFSATSRRNLKKVSDLYIKAGKLFEEATEIYKALRPYHARQEDVDRSYDALEHCLKAVKELKARDGSS